MFSLQNPVIIKFCYLYFKLTFTDTQTVLGAASDGHKVSGTSDTANGVHASDVGLVGDGVQTGDQRRCEEAAKAVLVQEVGDHCGHDFRSEFAVFTKFVETLLEDDLVQDGLSIRGKARKTNVNLVGNFVNLKTKMEQKQCKLTFLTLVAKVVICSPNLKSVAMQMHSSPAIARTVPPL